MRNNHDTILPMRRIGWFLFAAIFLIGGMSFTYACWVAMHVFIPGAPFMILFLGLMSILFFAIAAMGIFKAMQSTQGKA